jgi:hypothetical protein
MGAPVRKYRPQPGESRPADCYALNVDRRRAAWAYPYSLFFGGYRNGTLGSCRVVCRGPRLYVQEKPCTEWDVLDIAG